MRIAINTLGATAGVGISAPIHLFPALANIDTHNRYIIFFSPKQREIAQAIPESFQRVAVHYVPRNPYLRVLWEQMLFPMYLLWYRIHVVYSTGGSTSICAPCKVVLCMENSNPFSPLHLQWPMKDRMRNTLLKYLGWLSTKRASIIRFPSYNTQRFLMSQLKIPPQKCVVIPHGCCFHTHNTRTLNRSRPPSILTIGVNGPHRNADRLLKALFILIHHYDYRGNLIMVGNTGSRQHTQTLIETVKNLELSHKVSLEGEVPHQTIGAYFERADVLVFPSIEETFGVPLLEAMTFGVPIVASDCDRESTYRGTCFNPFKEICADAAHYFNPFDIHDMAQQIHTVLSNDTYQRQLVERGRERLKCYHIENTAKALIALFGQL